RKCRININQTRPASFNRQRKPTPRRSAHPGNDHEHPDHIQPYTDLASRNHRNTHAPLDAPKVAKHNRKQHNNKQKRKNGNSAKFNTLRKQVCQICSKRVSKSKNESYVNINTKNRQWKPPSYKLHCKSREQTKNDQRQDASGNIKLSEQTESHTCTTSPTKKLRPEEVCRRLLA